MAAFSTTPKTFGGFAIDRSVFRRLLPDERWVIYGAGLVDPGDGNTATISVVYQKDDGTFVTLGSITQVGGGLTKRTIGPLDLYGTAGVPTNEGVPIVRLRAVKDAGTDGEVFTWSLFLRLLPARQ